VRHADFPIIMYLRFHDDFDGSVLGKTWQIANFAIKEEKLQQQVSYLPISLAFIT
jgi:hypothetical protein